MVTCMVYKSGTGAVLVIRVLWGPYRSSIGEVQPIRAL